MPLQNSAQTLPSVRDAFDFAWGVFKEHYGLFMGIIMTFFASWVILEVIVIAGQRFGILLWAVAHLGFFILFAGLEVGFIRICLTLQYAKQASYSDVFRGLGLAVKFCAVQLVYILTVLVGLILFIIPGIYFGTRYFLYGFCFADGHPDLRQSFQQSALAGQGLTGFLFRFSLLLLLLNIAGASLLGIGLIVTLPLSVLMKAFVYRQLRGISPSTLQKERP